MLPRLRRLPGPALLRFLLWTLGLLLRVACRFSSRFRAQVTTDLMIEVSSADGVAHHYEFRRADRSMASRAGRAPRTADLALEFDTAFLGFRTLIRSDGPGTIVNLCKARRARYTGNAVYVLWFWSLTRMVLPYGQDRPLKGEGLPGALAAPNPTSRVADRIVREPVADALDPTWKAADAARSQMALLRGSRGEDVVMW